MPNWCQGVLKVRGKKRNLIKFINNVLEIPNRKDMFMNIKPISDEYGDLFLTVTCFDTIHFKDTRRCFLIKNIEWHWDSVNENDGLDNVYVQCLDIQQAWYLETQQFVAWSKEFKVDFKIRGYEKGGQFTQEIIVENGNLIKNEEKKYKNYEWEVDDPRLGG